MRALTDADGQVVAEYTYGAYGTIETSIESLVQPFRFTSREYDGATGLYHYRAQAYDPAPGRFLQEDPIGFDAGDLNVYRYTWNNPLNWTDPSGMSASEGAAVASMGMRAAGGMRATGMAVKCMFDTVGSVLKLINDHHGTDGMLTEGMEYLNDASRMASGRCGAATKLVKPFRSCKLKRAAKVLMGVASFTLGNSFQGDTPVLTTQGYVAIRDVEPGMKVAAIEEQSGRVVWRTVLETYERTAPGVLHLTVDPADGSVETLTTTPEHPFHIEGWDGTTDTLLADLGGASSAPEPEQHFPTEGRDRVRGVGEGGAEGRGRDLDAQLDRGGRRPWRGDVRWRRVHRCAGDPPFHRA